MVKASANISPKKKLSTNKRIVLLVPSDWYLFTHRSEIIVALIKAGFDVHVVAELSVPPQDRPVEYSKVTFHSSSGKAKLGSSTSAVIAQWVEIRKIIKVLKPDLVHVITIRMLMLAPLLLFSFRQKAVISIAGLGKLKSQAGVRAIFVFILRILVWLSVFNRRREYIFQNEIDKQYFLGLRNSASRKNVSLIRGAGVNLNKIKFSKSRVQNANRILFASRLLKSKGVLSYINAVKSIKEKTTLQPTLCGRLDPGGEDSLTELDLINNVGSADVDIIINADNVDYYMQESAIFVLPSFYAEGLPKAVLEAMAGGAVVITTDWPDVTKVIQNGENGIVIPKGSLTDKVLAENILQLAQDPKRRLIMAENARNVVQEKFSVSAVVDCHMKIYKRLLDQ